MVPEKWRKDRVDYFLEKVVNPVYPEPEAMYQEIGIRSHGKGIFHKEPVTGKQLGNKRVFKIQRNCFVVNIVFAWELAVAKTSDDELGMIASHRFPMFHPRKDRCDIDYITYFFKSPRGKYLLGLASPGGAGRNKTLGQSEFARVELLLPPIEEQKKIAQTLSTWDQAIEATEKLINNSQQQKKSIMQQLLNGKKRLPGFSGEWRKVHLHECATCLDNRRVPLNKEQRSNMKGSIPYWGANGVVDYVNDFIFDETIVLLAEDGGYFDEYSSRPIANISHGKAWVNNHAHILTAKNNATNGWIYFSLVHKNILGYVNGGTRAKLNKKDMLLIPILLPSVDEQQAITSVLSAANKEIETLEHKLEFIKQEKQALMQQLLTGKRRVKIDEHKEVEQC